MSDVTMKTGFVSLAAMILVTIGGCADSSGPISGLVKFEDGSPVTSGSIEFRSTSDKQRYASRISIDGGFRPVDQDGTPGLPPGSYDVVVVQIVLTEDLALEAHSHGGTVPRRYADYYTSGLTIEVSADQTEPVEVVVELDSEDHG